MRLLKRNTRRIWYCLYEGLTEPPLDDEGFPTCETVAEYGEPQELTCTVNFSGGQSRPNAFGTLETYQDYMYVDDPYCPIDENSVLFIDCDEEPENAYGYTHKVIQVSRSLNHVRYTIAKVSS